MHYSPVGQACSLPDLNYAQPKFLTPLSASATATSPDLIPNTIKPDDDETTGLTFASHWPKQP